MSLNPTLRRQVNLWNFKASLIYTMSLEQPELHSETVLKIKTNLKAAILLKD